MNNRNKNHKEIFQRVIAFLSRQQVDLLDRIGKDVLFSKGSKLSRTKIISCLVDLLKELEVTGEDISSAEELKQKIKEKIYSNWPTTREILNFKTIKTKQDDKGDENG